MTSAVIFPLLLKNSLLEKTRREVLTAVELLNFVRLGIKILCLVLCCAHYTLHFLIIFFLNIIYFLIPILYFLATTEGYVKATLKTFLWN